MAPKLISIIAAISLVMIFPGGDEPSMAFRTEDGIVIPSFDGEPIVGTLLLPTEASIADPVPVVLRTHGWGQRRLRTPDRLMQRLLDSGYAIFTWDSRGFGHSGGEANWGSPDHEVRDASAVLDYLAARPEIAMETLGDPMAGWIGASNAGGVQLNAASTDTRIDAIVPQNAWGNLLSDLMPNDVYKKGWGNRLYRRGLVGARSDGLEADNPAGPQDGDYAEQIHAARASWNSTGEIGRDLREWFLTRSTTVRSAQISVPTMIVHGAIDTLFPLQGALTNYRKLRQAGTPVKLLVYCSGHTLQGCPYPGGRSGYPEGGATWSVWEQRIVSWLDRYVKGDTSISTGPEVEWQAPDGYYYAAPGYPLGGTRYRTSAAFETMMLRGSLGDGGDELADAGPAPREALGYYGARHQVVPRSQKARPIFGVPKVDLSGRLRRARSGVLQLELVNVAPNGTRTTVNRQATPVRLREGENRLRLRLSAVAWVLRPGHRLQIEITTGSPMFRPDEGGYVVKLRVRTHVPISPSRWAAATARS